MRNGRVHSVDFLTALNDEDRIEEARQLLKDNGPKRGADGFEVWDGTRFVYRYPEVSKD